MSIIEQAITKIPLGSTIKRKAQDGYAFSKDLTLQIYNQTKQKMVQSKQGYLLLQTRFQNNLYNIIQKTVNQILGKTEGFVGIQTQQKNKLNLKLIPARVRIIVQTIFCQHLLNSRIITNEHSQSLIKGAKNVGVAYLVPIYISLSATLIVSQAMLMQFFANRIQAIKLTYQFSKDHFTMFVLGNFNQETIRQKLSQGLTLFKQMTVKVVSKGLQIRVDRQSLVQNYDKFAVNALQLMRQVKQKGEGNIHSFKKKSKDLYQDVIKKIKAKQIQLNTQFKTQYPKLATTQTK